MLVVNGKLVPAAEIYQNDKIPAFLILSSALPSPVMLTPRAGTVESVNLMKIAKQKDGSVDLLADAVLAPLGQFQMDGENIAFTAGGKKVSLNPKPALTGPHKAVGPARRPSPSTSAARAATSRTRASIAALKKDTKPVTVHVVFGSWCPHCRQHVPLMLKVEKRGQEPEHQVRVLRASRALPDGWKDPEVKRLGVKGIPTAIVYVNGLEAGRIEGRPWSRARGGARQDRQRLTGGEGEVGAGEAGLSTASGSIPPLCQVASGDCSSPGAGMREIPSSGNRGSSAQASSPASAAPWRRPRQGARISGRRARSFSGWTRTVRSPGDGLSSGLGSTITVPSRSGSADCQRPRISASRRRCWTAAAEERSPAAPAASGGRGRRARRRAARPAPPASPAV